MHSHTAKVALLTAAASVTLVSAGAVDFSSIPSCVMGLAEDAFMNSGCFPTDIGCICKEANGFLPSLITEAEAECGSAFVTEALNVLKAVCKEAGNPITSTYTATYMPLPTATSHTVWSTGYQSWSAPASSYDHWSHPVPTVTESSIIYETVPCETATGTAVPITTPSASGDVSGATSISATPTYFGAASAPEYGFGGGKAPLFGAVVAIIGALLF